MLTFFGGLLGAVAISDDQRRAAAERIREALRLADIGIRKAALWMEVDPAVLERWLSGPPHRFDLWRLEMLPDVVHQHKAVLELRDRGLPDYARTCLKIGSLVKEKP